MNENNTNWSQSVTAVVIREGRVLLARHTYGSGKGKLILPGGYAQFGESPQDALRREYMEETGVAVEPEEVIGIRFNSKDWYIAFRGRYISGEARPDGDENSEVLWLETGEALTREDVPGLTKALIKAATSGVKGLTETDYTANTARAPYSLYSTAGEKQ